VSAGVGLVVLGAIFAFGVVLFALLMISLLPGATLLEEQLEAFRARRAARRAEDTPAP
jgi:hypothetical protein